MRLYKNSLVGQILSSMPLLLAAIGRDREQRLTTETLRRQKTWGLEVELYRYILAWVSGASLLNLAYS